MALTPVALRAPSVRAKTERISQIPGGARSEHQKGPNQVDKRSVPKIPIIKILIMLFLTFFFVFPGLIYYLFVVRSLRKLQNIVVTTTPGTGECFVLVSYPKNAQKIVDGFAAALPRSGSMVAAIGR